VVGVAGEREKGRENTTALDSEDVRCVPDSTLRPPWLCSLRKIRTGRNERLSTNVCCLSRPVKPRRPNCGARGLPSSPRQPTACLQECPSCRTEGRNHARHQMEQTTSPQPRNVHSYLDAPYAVTRRRELGWGIAGQSGCTSRPVDVATAPRPAQAKCASAQHRLGSTACGGTEGDRHAGKHANSRPSSPPAVSRPAAPWPALDGARSGATSGYLPPWVRIAGLRPRPGPARETRKQPSRSPPGGDSVRPGTRAWAYTAHGSRRCA